MYNLAETWPPLLWALTVKVAAGVETVVGVPEMTPVLVLRLNPSGSLASTEKADRVPVIVGVRVTGLPTVNVCVPDGYVRLAVCPVV